MDGVDAIAWLRGVLTYLITLLSQSPLVVHIYGGSLPSMAGLAGRLKIIRVEAFPAVGNRQDVIHFGGRYLAVAFFPNLANWILSNIDVAEPSPVVIVAAIMRVWAVFFCSVFLAPTLHRERIASRI